MNQHDIGLIIDGAAGISTFYLAVWLVHNEVENWRDRKAPARARARRADKDPDFVDTFTNPALIDKGHRP